MGMSEKKAGIRELSPIDVYKLLPKTNCKECGVENCMAFATKIVNREITIDECKPLLKKENKKTYKKLKDMLKPAVKEVFVGVGDKAVKLGGKLVMFRHEFTYMNPTAIAIDVTDEMPEAELIKRVKQTESFSYEYIGYTLKLNMVAVRSTSNEPEKFKAAVKKVAENTSLPLILCSLNANVLEAGLMAVPNAKPLLYAATMDNWKDMAELALMYHCPLVVFAPNDLSMLTSLAKTLVAYGVEDLVLDPGTFPDDGWSLLPNTVLRQNIYTDPRKPVAVEPGLKVFGTPNENSPVFFTTNFALTYYTVASDIESSKLNAYVVVVDTEGSAVDSGVAGRKLTADKVAEALKASGLESRVKHKTIIIPGKASRISGEIEKASGWKVRVGPRDSSEIPKYIIDKWQP